LHELAGGLALVGVEALVLIPIKLFDQLHFGSIGAARPSGTAGRPSRRRLVDIWSSVRWALDRSLGGK
jgi:hypothetical protein